MRKKFTSAIFVTAALTACGPAPALTLTPVSTITNSAVSATATRAVTSTGTTTPTLTAPPSPSATVVPKPGPTSPPQASPSVGAYSLQYEITEKDSGKTFVYPETSRFQIILDQSKYPKENFKVTCDADGVLISISNLPSVSPPYYAVRHEGANPGKCTLTDNDFSVNVEIARPD